MSAANPWRVFSPRHKNTALETNDFRLGQYSNRQLGAAYAKGRRAQFHKNLEVIAVIEKDRKVALIAGRNPGIEELLLWLTGKRLRLLQGIAD